MKELFLLTLIPISIYAVQTRKLRNAIISLCTFSLIASVVYLLMNAPDVAVAEAVIGTTISTILFLVAMQKYKVFNVYFLLDDDYLTDSAYYERTKNQMTQALEKFCAKQELELHMLYTNESMQDILQRHQFAIIIKESKMRHDLYGHPENLKLEALNNFLEGEQIEHNIHFLMEVNYEA